jgi:PST family polysaccharide transporter
MSIENPTCSVVMAAYNAAETIDQAIASVLAQTLSDLELIVIDDGSTDDTAERVRAHTADPRVRLHRQDNAGPSRARNRAIELARGRYVGILDSDDVWLPDYLELMVGALERAPGAAFAYTRAWVLDRAANRVRGQTWPVRLPRVAPGDADALLKALVAENFVNSSATIRRDILREVGGYDPWVGVSEDYELWLRIAAEGHGATAVDRPLLVRSDRPGSLTKDALAMCAGKKRAFDRLLAREALPPEVRARAEQGRAEMERARALHAGEQHPTARDYIRRLAAGTTRSLLGGTQLRPSAPPEVASAFPGLGTGTPERAPGSLTKTVIRGAGISGIGYAVAQAISFGSYLALARLLTPAQFGMFAAGIVVSGLGTVIGESGLLAALIQRRERLEEALESAFVATLAAGVLLSVLALAAAPLVGRFFHSSTITVVAAVMSASMLFRLLEIVPSALLQRRFSFVRRVAIDPLGMVAFAAGSIVPAVAGLGVWSLVIGAYAQFTVSLIGAWWFAGWVPHPRRASVRVWRELARFGRPVVIAELIRRAIPELPVVALGNFAGAGAIGQYSYALRVASQPPDAMVSLGAYVVLPALARLADDERRFRAALTRALRWMCAISFPLGMLLVALGTPAIVLVFGSRWHAAGEAVVPLGVYAGMLALDSIASEVWKAAGRTDMLPRMHGLSFALMAILIAALVVPFGLIGVTSAIAASGVGVAIYAVYGIHRVARVALSRLFAEISPAALSALAVGAALFCLEHLLVHAAQRGTAAGIALLAGEAALGAIAYLACLVALSRGVRTDLAAALARLFPANRPQVAQRLLEHGRGVL